MKIKFNENRRLQSIEFCCADGAVKFGNGIDLRVYDDTPRGELVDLSILDFNMRYCPYCGAQVIMEGG